MRFWKRNKAFFKLAVLSNLEYRLNYFIDAILQPMIAAGIEVTLWYSLFHTLGKTEIGGYAQNSYLAYALWTAFVTRISINWMYEFRMIEDIESGTINSLLVRPISFFESHLSQFLGYKIVTTLISLSIPLTVTWVFGLPFDYSKIPLALGLVTYYLFFLHLTSFCVATFAFHLNKIHSFTVAKNLTLWVLCGELFPLDLLPEPLKSIIINLPFSSGVYLPVGYLTGRVSHETLMQGFLSTTVGIFIFAVISIGLWKKGLSSYSGTGA